MTAIGFGNHDARGACDGWRSDRFASAGADSLEAPPLNFGANLGGVTSGSELCH